MNHIIVVSLFYSPVVATWFHPLAGCAVSSLMIAAHYTYQFTKKY